MRDAEPLCAEQSGLELGERHGARIRGWLAARWSSLHARAGGQAATLARACLDRLDAHAPALAAEQRGVARACGVEPAELAALDGGFVDVALGEAGSERSLVFYVDGPRGAVLSGAWAFAEAEAEQIELRRVAPGGPRVLGLPGSFGLAGASAAGFAIAANLLRPALPGPGILGAAALRLALEQHELAAARASVERTPLLDGRAWLMVDGHGLFGIEQLDEQCVLTRVSPKTGHVHANHCFDPALRQREGLPRSPASFRRMELASTLYVQQRPNTAERVLEFLAEVERAAFPHEPERRAEVHWAHELSSGRSLLRRRAGGRVEVFEREPSP